MKLMKERLKSWGLAWQHYTILGMGTGGAILGRLTGDPMLGWAALTLCVPIALSVGFSKN